MRGRWCTYINQTKFKIFFSPKFPNNVEVLISYSSCRYGDHCKFSHSTTNTQPQQQQQQQSNSPFGFGQQPKGPPSSFASFPKQQQNQFKPFENKWTRTPDTNNAPLSAKQSNDQSQAAAAAANHVCNKTEECKHLMLEDFQNERPLWRLTCYAHFKYLPCDISGDISYEELRAAAYDDAKKGLSLSSVVERERNLLNSKLIEFENLLRNPCVISPNTVIDRPSSFPSINTIAFSAASQNKVPPPVSSFSQLGFSANQGSNTSAVASTNSSFVKPNPFPVSSQISSPFGAVASSNSSFPQQSTFPISSQTSNPFGAVASSNSSFGQQSVPTSFGSNNLNFGTQGLFGSQQHMQPQGNTSISNIPMGFGNNLTTFSTSISQSANVTSNQSPSFSIGHNTANTLGGQTYVGNNREGNGDMSIWLKDWNIGEIPEEAPPDRVCV